MSFVGFFLCFSRRLWIIKFFFVAFVVFFLFQSLLCCFYFLFSNFLFDGYFRILYDDCIILVIFDFHFIGFSFSFIFGFNFFFLIFCLNENSVSYFIFFSFFQSQLNLNTIKVFFIYMHHKTNGFKIFYQELFQSNPAYKKFIQVC